MNVVFFTAQHKVDLNKMNLPLQISYCSKRIIHVFMPEIQCFNNTAAELGGRAWHNPHFCVTSLIYLSPLV